jgi:hypothetical protein
VAVTDDARRSRLSWRQLAAALAAIVLATAVLPPLGAYVLNQSRVERAATDTRRLADDLRPRPEVVTLAGDGVVCGTGRLPLARGAGLEWLANPTTIREVFGAGGPQDPWGRCYLANLGDARRGVPVLVLSAGPNGFIDTPLGAPGPAGDDIGARVW